MKAFTWTNFAITILFLCVIGLGIVVFKRPAIVEVFEEKQPDEAYVRWVSGTEYIAGDSFGQAIIEVQDYRGRPLNASCNLTMVYPNQAFVFIDALMTPSVLAGHYYKDFTVPNSFGIYVEWVNCSIQLRPNFNITASRSNSFHVNPAFNIITNISYNITQFWEEFNNFTIDVKNNFTNIENTINNLSIDINNNFTELGDNMTWNFNNTNYNINIFRNEVYTWYVDIRNRIYQCCQKWLEDLGDLIPSNIIQKVPLGSGVTQGQDSWWKRIIGGD